MIAPGRSQIAGVETAPSSPACRAVHTRASQRATQPISLNYSVLTTYVVMHVGAKVSWLKTQICWLARCNLPCLPPVTDRPIHAATQQIEGAPSPSWSPARAHPLPPET